MSDLDVWKNLQDYYKAIGDGVVLLKGLVDDLEAGNVDREYVDNELRGLLIRYKNAEYFLDVLLDYDEMCSIVAGHYRDVGLIYMSLGMKQEAIKSYKMALKFFSKENLTVLYEQAVSAGRNITLEELKVASDATRRDIERNIGFCIQGDKKLSVKNEKNIDCKQGACAKTNETSYENHSVGGVVAFLAVFVVVFFCLLLMIFV